MGLSSWSLGCATTRAIHASWSLFRSSVQACSSASSWSPPSSHAVTSRAMNSRPYPPESVCLELAGNSCLAVSWGSPCSPTEDQMPVCRLWIEFVKTRTMTPESVIWLKYWFSTSIPSLEMYLILWWPFCTSWSIGLTRIVTYGSGWLIPWMQDKYVSQL